MNEEQQERYRVIKVFQTVSASEGAHLRSDPCDTSDQYNQNLSDMITRYGHEVSTHAYVMMSLDDLIDRKSLQTIRGLAQQIVYQACRLKEDHPAGSRQAQGYGELETRVAVLWRHLMLRDNGTLPLQRQIEYKNIAENSPSDVLKAQLPFVKDHVYPPFRHAVTYS